MRRFPNFASLMRQLRKLRTPVTRPLSASNVSRWAMVPLRLESLDARTTPSTTFLSDPVNAGKFIVQFQEDVPGLSDNLTLQVSGGQLQYQLNGSGFTSDLNSSTPGTQTLTFSSISRIDVALMAGNDTLTLDTIAGSVIPAISGVNYNGGNGTDSIVAAQDANFTLTNISLTISPGGVVNLIAVEQANLTGGNSPNTMDASAFTAGSVTMD